MKFVKNPLAIALAITPMYLAAQEQSLALEEVVVTAQKREQSLQDVPIAVSAMSADFIEQTGSVTLADVANVTPGLNISNSQAEEISITMRGIGSNDFGYSSDESIPVYLDGVYMGGGSSVIGDLMDIAQLEVLKGPQGTLFGRNAVGGAVSVTTQKPTDEFEAKVSLGGGNYDLKTAKAMVNLPVLDNELYLRISGSLRERDGWQKNATTDKRDGYAQDRWNSRVKLLWLPSDNVEVELTSDWQREQDHAGYYNVIGGDLANALGDAGAISGATFDYLGDTASNGNAFLALDPMWLPDLVGPEGSAIDHLLHRKVRGNGLKVTWDINDYLTFTSITSYREIRSEISEDNDGSEFLVLNIRSYTDNQEYSQEFRLSGQGESLDWFVGLSAYRSDVDGSVADSFGALVTGFNFDEAARVHAKTESYALFGDAIWAMDDLTNITFGLRASYDAKSQNLKNTVPGLLFAAPGQLLGADGFPDPSLANSHENWSNVSPRLVVDHLLNDDVMIYAGVTQGYKSGGFNSFPSVDIDPASLTFGLVPFGSTAPFNEEKITNYEAGFKSTLMDGRLRLNGSVFYYEFEDLQFLVTQGATVQAKNAGKASGRGIDLETVFKVSEGLTVSANLGWLNAEYGADVRESDGSLLARDGQDLAYAPHFSGNLALDYQANLGELGTLRSHLNYAYTGKRTHNTSSEDDIYKEGSVGLLSGRITYIADDESWELALWGSNLTDEDTIESYGETTDDFGFISVRRGEPRTFGVEAVFYMD